MKIDKEFWTGKKIFITGGTGFIGNHLTNKLVSLGANVKLFVHKTQPLNKELIGVQSNLIYPNSYYKKFIKSFQPEIIFHLAAQAIVGIAMENELDTAEINIKGTYNLLNACKNITSIKSFLHIASDKVYGKVEEILDDSPLLGSTHPYNATKLCGDIMAQMYGSSFGIPITIVRNGNIYGTNDLHWDRLIPGTVKQLFNNERPVCRGGSRDYIYVDDIVDGYLKLVEVRYGKEEVETVNLGAASPTNTLDIITLIASFMNKNDTEIIFSPLWKGELVNQHIISEKAKKLIDWCPDIPLSGGLLATVRWYESYLRIK